MNSVERVKSICKERKISISKLEKDCGFGNGYIRNLREGKFPSDRLAVISNYLELSYDYLLTGKEPDIPTEIDPDSIELIEIFNKFNKEQRKAIIDMLRSLAPMD